MGSLPLLDGGELPADLRQRLVRRRTLFFDLDGTLTDPREGITRCIADALREAGVPPPPAASLERYIGPPLMETFTAFLGRSDLASRAVECYRERYGAGGIFENRAYEGIEAAVRAAAAGRRAFVVTSKPWAYAERILRHFALDTLFERAYGAELSGERSDKRDLLRWVLEREGLHPEDCVMIGDREHDIIAARANGVMAGGVLWGFGPAEELEAAGADFLVASVPALHTWPR